MQEEIEVILQRLHDAPRTCWIAEDDAGPCGYLLAYPSRLGAVTPLGGHFCLVSNADTLYLHDLAVPSRMAGKGVGSALVELAMQAAAAWNISSSALVSVQGSRQYWMRLGYTAMAPDLQYAANLKSYPDDAVYMVKRLCGS
ncbi:hypothetical protein AYR66_18900 [Noviherbaspirillum denitrificans]|uniref:N-acetyltransferase domain-containing protein n=2 Tax=Noviherbaspirillum denitrificans TaxID=1968433 RepID=A0A254TF15_9BURK|nr:hypothetical protein AYR66_18900 [Noviherbaspirillum denitrificans]